MFVLDTDILVGFLRGKKDAIKKIEELYKVNSTISVSVLSVFELVEGAYLSFHREKTLNSVFSLLNNLNIVDLNKPVSVLAGEISAHLKDKGLIIGVGDILIGATAINSNSTLITKNKNHFERIPELKLEVW